MTLRQAAQMALEALQYPLETSSQAFDADKAELLSHRAIDALRAALAKPEQQPVAWVWPSELEKVKQPGQGRRASIRAFCSPELPALKGLSGLLPLYTATTPRKPLMQQEIDKIILQTQITMLNYCDDEVQTRFARAIEAAHGIREQP